MNETIKATASALAVIIVNVASLFGIGMDEGVWADGLCAVAMLLSTMWGIWHNHNFTHAAQEGQKVTDGIKAGGEAD